MSFRKFNLSLVLVLGASLLFGGCVDSEDEVKGSAAQESGKSLTLFDFDDGELPASVSLTDSTAEFVSGSGGKALKLSLSTKDHQYAGIVIEPEEPWDWSDWEDFSILVDMYAPGVRSTQISIVVKDASGAAHTRSIVVSRGEAKTYYSKLDGHDLGSPSEDEAVELNLNSGLRSNPPTWESEDVQFAWMWGTKNLDLSAIASIQFSASGAGRDKEVVIDNIRIERNPPMDPIYLVGLVDEFGQSAKLEFDQKVHSMEELLAARDAELADLAKDSGMARSKFGGWSEGPRLEGTGFFRTEKYKGKWSLVDPEGYLYFATGIDILRIGDGTTMTGYDFEGKVPGEDVKPESQERYISSEIRANMFEWLPEYDSEFRDCYIFADSVHSGAIPKGEGFDFYRSNLARRYGDMGDGDYVSKWREVTVDRMLNWGFTSLGNWTDPSFYDNDRIPFFANGWIRGDYKTVSSGSDFWSPMPDPFDAGFAEAADEVVKRVSEEVAGSPWCVGAFFDNELSFGRPNSTETLYGIPIHTLRRDGAEVPTKAAFTELMKEKYGAIEKLGAAWELEIASWEAFDKGVDSTLRTDAQLEDYSLLLEAYAMQYHKVVAEAMDRYMPDHLYLGSRLPNWGMPMEVVRAAAAYVDVVSYNAYKDILFPEAWAFLEEIDMPSIIGEYQIGALDAGHYHFGIVCAEDQKERAVMYREYTESVRDNPYFVGAHWFQYMDSPITGRIYDGENYNNGFVRVTDIPYEPLVKEAKAFHSEMYKERFGE